MSNNFLMEAEQFTIDKLNKFRADIFALLENSLLRDNICIVVTGSYGRREASSESDIDWYVVWDTPDYNEDKIKQELADIVRLIDSSVPNPHGTSGTFGAQAITSFESMLKNIGGSDDTNATLTRRMLFLLEGDWLYNQRLFDKCRHELLKCYIKESDVSDNISRFLLNDIIRYYRTIATDFEYKVVESGKEWGLRNIKLKFSRKLLYFSGVIAVAAVSGLEYTDRIKKAEEVFLLSRVQRIQRLVSGGDVALDKYQQFLEKIARPEVRAALKAVTKESRSACSVYNELNDLSAGFSVELYCIVKHNYPDDVHALQRSLVL